jgi:hypothetical protein
MDVMDNISEEQGKDMETMIRISRNPSLLTSNAREAGGKRKGAA